MTKQLKSFKQTMNLLLARALLIGLACPDSMSLSAKAVKAGTLIKKRPPKADAEAHRIYC